MCTLIDSTTLCLCLIYFQVFSWHMMFFISEYNFTYYLTARVGRCDKQA